MLAASIDAGTNTFRLLIAQSTDARPPWRRLAYEQEIVRLGEGLRATGRLQPEAMARALDVLSRFSDLLCAHQIPSSRLKAAATAAVREAANGGEFLARVQDATGIALEVISGEEEARLSLAGAYAALDQALVQDWLLVDIGGGSTEFVRARRDELMDAISVPIGVVKLTEAFVHSDPPSSLELASLGQAIDDALAQVEARWRQKKLGVPRTLVATAGTPTTLAAWALDLARYDPDRVQGFFFDADLWERLKRGLLEQSAAQRAAHPMIPPKRADVLPAGIVLLDRMIRRWKRDGFYVSDAGLLEGLWLSAYGLIR